MKITWFGNSSFLIKTSLGKKILIDPFTILGTFKDNIDADIISFSKNLYNNFKANNFSKIIYSTEGYSNKDILIKGYSSYSDNCSGLKRGGNIIYLYQINNIKLCHLGYLGHNLNSELINILKNCDILFIPIGGHICLNGHNANKLCNLLDPKYIFPMCYKKSTADFYLDGPKDFLSHNNNIFLIKDNTIDISELPKDNNNLVLMSNYI